MGLREYRRHSAKVARGARWKALRMQALDRDGWQCVKCGSRRRLECDHVEPVRDRPDLAWAVSNLQILCGPCHSRKTRIEVGLSELPPKRRAWRDLLQEMQKSNPNYEVNRDA